MFCGGNQIRIPMSKRKCVEKVVPGGAAHSVRDCSFCHPDYFSSRDAVHYPTSNAGGRGIQKEVAEDRYYYVQVIR